MRGSRRPRAPRDGRREALADEMAPRAHNVDRSTLKTDAGRLHGPRRPRACPWGPSAMGRRPRWIRWGSSTGVG